jgi:hypothetical protein
LRIWREFRRAGERRLAQKRLRQRPKDWPRISYVDDHHVSKIALKIPASTRDQPAIGIGVSSDAEALTTACSVLAAVANLPRPVIQNAELARVDQ